MGRKASEIEGKQDTFSIRWCVHVGKKKMQEGRRRPPPGGRPRNGEKSDQTLRKKLSVTYCRGKIGGA